MNAGMGFTEIEPELAEQQGNTLGVNWHG